MGGKSAKHLKNLHDELQIQTLPIKDLALVTYEQLKKRIDELNSISETIIDDENYKLVFMIKKDTDTSIFWKKTIQISCFKLDKATDQIETNRLLSLVELLHIYRLMVYQLGSDFTAANVQADQKASVESVAAHGESSSSDVHRTIPKYVEAGETKPPLSHHKVNARRIEHLTTSMILNSFGQQSEDPSLTECCICMERKPEVILPCTHNYCLPCIEQWNVCHKTCPICRETLKNTDDTWVLSEAPDSAEMASELSKTLMKLTD